MAESDEKVVFPVGAEGLLRVVGDALTPRLKARLREADLDPDRPFPPAWPADRFNRWIDLIVDELYPGVPRGRAYWELGERFIEAWRRTFLGAASARVLRVVGPIRSLSRLTRAFRTGDNFTETSVEFLSSTEAMVTIHTIEPAEFMAGQMTGAVKHIFEINAEVELQPVARAGEVRIRLRLL